MKKYFFYIVMAIATTCFTTSCNDDNENSLEEWKKANEAIFNSIKNNSEYTELKSQGNEGSIYYKVLKKGTGTKPIYYTSKVSFYAKGRFTVNYAGYSITDETICQKWLYDDGIPFSTTVSNFTMTGIRTTLQNMVEGDKWEIWIPCRLNGSASGKNSVYPYFSSSGTTITIPQYSTLVYELEVVSVK